MAMNAYCKSLSQNQQNNVSKPQEEMRGSSPEIDWITEGAWNGEPDISDSDDEGRTVPGNVHISTPISFLILSS
jgi:hypothetical protein